MQKLICINNINLIIINPATQPNINHFTRQNNKQFLGITDENAIPTAPINPLKIPGSAFTLCTPNVSYKLNFYSKNFIKYCIPKTQIIPDAAPINIQAAGLQKSPVLDPTPITPANEPLNKSITLNFPFK